MTPRVPAELREDHERTRAIWSRVLQAFRRLFSLHGPIDTQLLASMLLWATNTDTGRKVYENAAYDVDHRDDLMS